MNALSGDCRLCGGHSDELTQLDLYVGGSEGIRVCLRCRMILTETARSIQSVASSSYLRGLKYPLRKNK